jgi:hypothetical protein
VHFFVAVFDGEARSQSIARVSKRFPIRAEPITSAIGFLIAQFDLRNGYRVGELRNGGGSVHALALAEHADRFPAIAHFDSGFKRRRRFAVRPVSFANDHHVGAGLERGQCGLTADGPPFRVRFPVFIYLTEG